MSILSILLIVAIAAAIAYGALRKQRRILSGAIAVAVVTVLCWLLFGLGGVRFVAWAAIVIAVAAVAAWLFKAALVAVLPHHAAIAVRTAPLTASFGAIVIILYALAAIFAPALAPYGEAAVVGQAYAPPSADMWLGADQLGRDMLSRLIFGARNTVGIAFVTTGLAFIIGSVTGLLAATIGGWFDQLLSRIVDILMAIPPLIFALLILTIVGASIPNMVMVIALLYSTMVYRLTRAVAGNIVVMDYIEAARLRGESSWYLIRREILPNAIAPLVAEFGLRFCFVFLMIAALSFLGLGIQPPTADWGSMVRENATLISFGEMTPLIPAAAIALLTVSVNFVVDWMLNRYAGLKD